MFKKSELSSSCLDNSPPHCQLPLRAQQTAKTLLQLLAVFLVSNLIQVVRGNWTKGLKWKEKRGMEAGGERQSQTVAPINKGGKKKRKTRSWKQNNRLVDCWLTDKQEVEKRSWPFPLQVETEKCTTALGSKVMRQPCRQENVARAKEGESRNKKREKKRQGERRERQRSAKRHHAVDRLG